MNKEKIIKAVKSIQNKTDFIPDIAIVLGSGLGKLADFIEKPIVIPYEEIDEFPKPTVTGHGGKLVFGKVGEANVVVMQGRVHLYEGHSPEKVVLPVRTLGLLGIKTLILTNAAGGVNPAFAPGELMVIRDHLNLQCANPLSGPNDDSLGMRFPDMTEAYNKKLSDLIVECAVENEIDIRNGVYAGMTGPTYETPAEVNMVRILGADAVGMSTVAECIAANHMGIKVCGVSLITNMAAGLSKTKLTHEEVKETADQATEYFVELMLKVLIRLGDAN